MQNSGVHLPPCACLQPVSLGVKQQPIVTAIPVLETLPHIILRRPRLQPHKGVGELILFGIVLRRKVVSFRLPLASHSLGKLVRLMHVVRNWTEIVEKLAQDTPSAFSFHYFLAQQVVAGVLDGFAEQESLVAKPDIAQALILWGAGSVGGGCGRAEPALVDSSAMCSQCVEIVSVQPQAPTWNHKRARNPAGFHSQNSISGFHRLQNQLPVE